MKGNNIKIRSMLLDTSTFNKNSYFDLKQILDSNCTALNSARYSYKNYKYSTTNYSYCTKYKFLNFLQVFKI